MTSKTMAQRTLCALAALACLSLTACSDDDDSPSSGATQAEAEYSDDELEVIGIPTSVTDYGNTQFTAVTSEDGTPVISMTYNEDGTPSTASIDGYDCEFEYVADDTKASSSPQRKLKRARLHTEEYERESGMSSLWTVEQTLSNFRYNDDHFVIHCLYNGTEDYEDTYTYDGKKYEYIETEKLSQSIDISYRVDGRIEKMVLSGSGWEYYRDDWYPEDNDEGSFKASATVDFNYDSSGCLTSVVASSPAEGRELQCSYSYDYNTSSSPRNLYNKMTQQMAMAYANDAITDYLINQPLALTGNLGNASEYFPAAYIVPDETPFYMSYTLWADSSLRSVAIDNWGIVDYSFTGQYVPFD